MRDQLVACWYRKASAYKPGDWMTVSWVDEMTGPCVSHYSAGWPCLFMCWRQDSKTSRPPEVTNALELQLHTVGQSEFI